MSRRSWYLKSSKFHRSFNSFISFACTMNLSSSFFCKPCRSTRQQKYTVTSQSWSVKISGKLGCSCKFGSRYSQVQQEQGIDCSGRWIDSLSNWGSKFDILVSCSDDLEQRVSDSLSFTFNNIIHVLCIYAEMRERHRSSVITYHPPFLPSKFANLLLNRAGTLRHLWSIVVWSTASTHK